MNATDPPIAYRHFEDYVPGTTAAFGPIAMSAEEIVEFAVRYDPQPIHMDPAAAAAGPFGGLIASGWHTVAVVMRGLVRHYLAHGAALASPGIDELRWMRPVRPDDALHVRVTVIEANRSRSKPDRGMVRSLIEVMNQQDDIVMRMTAMNLILCRNAADPGANADPRGTRNDGGV